MPEFTVRYQYCFDEDGCKIAVVHDYLLPTYVGTELKLMVNSVTVAMQ